MAPPFLLKDGLKEILTFNRFLSLTSWLMSSWFSSLIQRDHSIVGKKESSVTAIRLKFLNGCILLDFYQGPW